MKTVGYRLRWITGIGLDSETYGSGLYGDGHYGEVNRSETYGMGNYGTGRYGYVQPEPVVALGYETVPWRAGHPVYPSWRYRQGDTEPAFQARILGDGLPADLSTAVDIQVILTPTDGRSRADERVYSGAIASTAVGMVTRIWQPGDLDIAGVYQSTVRIGFDTGRYLTAPCDSRHTFVVDKVYKSSFYGFGGYGSGTYGQSTYGGWT